MSPALAPPPAAASPALEDATPLQLPRLVMQRAGAVALLALLLAMGLSVLRARQDIADETTSALALAGAVQQLQGAAQLDDAALQAAAQAWQAEGALRHVALSLHDEQGRLRAGPPLPPADAALPRRELAVPRAGGPAWRATLVAAQDSERREAWQSMGQLLLVLGLGVAGMLAVMAWNVRRALKPLQALLPAIARIERGEPQAADALPPMGVHELQRICDALRHLHLANQDEQARRRVLARQVLTLQEDERQRLARELHDEFGQRLTALRVDAAWLARRTEGQAELQAVVQGMAAQCAQIQQDIRGLLARLQPLGPASAATPAGEAGTETAARLQELLQALVQGWQRSGTQPTAFALQCSLPAAQAGRPLPRELVLAIYRISQEALTNVARHAQARQATLSLHMASHDDGRCTLHWQVRDDGSGLPQPEQAMQRGSGLAGLRQRAWALGAELRCEDARPGLLLAADFEVAP
jgi:two-component system sensor histidine kinase UhpB